MKGSPMEKLLVICAAAAFAGCAGMSSTVPEDVVVSWRQLPEERGKLPVGRVVEVHRVHFQRDAEPPKNIAVPSPQAAGVIIAALPLMEAVRNADWHYRHTILMKDGTTRVLELNHRFETGVCVAFRSGLSEANALAIPALAGECG